ncbi:response regulator, partial [Enterococcus cecorum]|uniref:response regulator n=1 Tax=Enterococcus cecorum TaxID=44008 RepID=UPI001FABC748|nr:response regulator [Enterococcus cecorum]
MKVFVLEDNLMQRQRLVRIIEAYAQQKKMNIEVLDTAKVSELIQNIESESFDQLYFLDIDIKNESKKGLEIAQEIRKLDNRGTIVFVTTHSEFAPITYKYKVSALDFIDKSDPEMIQRVEEALQYVYEKYDMSDAEDDFILELPKRTIRLPFNDIYFFETIANHRIKLISK